MLEDLRNIDEQVIVKLLHLIPRSIYNTEKRLAYFLQEFIEDNEELSHILKQYPNVLYEPLDRYYRIFSALGSISEELIEDLCTYYHDNGIILASFLSILLPDKNYGNYLINAKNNIAFKGNFEIAEIAIAEVNNTLGKTHPKLADLIHEARSIILNINIPKVYLKPPHTLQELELIAEQNAKVKRIYKSEGTDAALSLIKELKNK